MEKPRKDYSRPIVGETSDTSPDWRDDDSLEKLASRVRDQGGGGLIADTLAKGVLRLLREKRGER